MQPIVMHATLICRQVLSREWRMEKLTVNLSIAGVTVCNFTAWSKKSQAWETQERMEMGILMKTINYVVFN